MPVKTYKAGERFPGRIERTVDESEPAWPKSRRAKPNAPNVVFIVLDDTGYGHLSCYGGLCETPNLGRDKLIVDDEATMRAVMAHQ